MNKISDLQIRIGADASGLKKELNATQEALKTGLNVKPVESLSSSISDVSKKTGDLIGHINQAAAAFSGAFGLSNLISSAVQAGDAVYTLSSRLGVSAGEAGQLSRILKLTGGDISSCATSIMRLDKSFSAAGTAGDKTRETLQNYGVSLTDASGKMLPLNQQLSNLAAGYKQAKAAGQEQAFLMDTLGVKGLSLAQTLDQYTEAAETASKVKGIGLDPQEMHKLNQDMKVMQMEASQVNLAFVSALAPIAQSVFPEIIKGLTSSAKFLAENKNEIRDLTKNVVTFIAIYKGLQVARSAMRSGQSTWKTISNALNADKIAEEKAQAELAARQEALIQKQLATVERSYEAQKKAAIRAATRMNLSAEETAKVIAEKLSAIEAKSIETSERIATTMRAGFAQAAQAASASAGEMNAALSETGARATETAAQVAEAHTAEAESAQEAVVAERELSAAMAGTGEAAVAAGESSVAAKTEVTASTTRETVAEEALTASEATAGTTATAAGGKAVAAATAATVATEKTALTTKGLTTATTVQMGAASRASATMVTGATRATGKVRALASAVLALASSWWVAAAAFAAYQGAKAAEAYAEKKGQETYELNGVTYYHNSDDGRWYTRESNPSNMTIEPSMTGGTENFAGELINIAQLGTHGDGQNMSLVTDIDTLKSLNSMQSDRYHNSEVGRLKDAEEEAKNEALRAQISVSSIDLSDPGMDISGGDASGGGGGSASAASAPPQKQMRTWYSFEDDDELKPWANEIEYASAYYADAYAKGDNDFKDLLTKMVAATIRTESDGVPQWSSDHLHYGLGQISEDISNRFGGGQAYGDGSDDNANIMAVANFMGYLLTKYNRNPEYAASAYNRGEDSGNPSANPDYVNKVMGNYNNISTSQVETTGGAAQAQAQPVAYPIPVGEVAAYIASTQFSDGEQWTGSLGNDIDGWCDDFTHEVYKRMFNAIGKDDPFGEGVVNDQNFRTLGAYHEADISNIAAQLHPGDLVDTPGHVGIYLGNGMVRSRQSSAGVHDLSLEDFNSTFGGIQGYGSIAEVTGGMTASSALIGKTTASANRGIDEALKKLQQAKSDAAKLSMEMSESILDEKATDYQKDWAKLYSDVQKKRQEINKIAATPGIDKATVKSLETTLDAYTDSIYQKFKQKWADAYAELYDTAHIALSKVRHDYQEEADLEYLETVRKLNKEYTEKKKQYMHDENDIETLKALQDWYYASLEEAEEKKRKSRQEAHDRYVEYLEEEGNLAMLVSYMGASTVRSDGARGKSEGEKAGERSLNLAGEKTLAKEYVKIWQAAHGSMSAYIADVSDSLYSTMTDDLAEFVRGTKSAKSALQDFGNSILSMMAKIVAQRLAATWMTNILGAFSGARGGTSAAWTWGGTTHSNTFGYAGVSPAAQFTSSIANTASISSHLKVPGFASGGIVTAPTLAMVGEGGDREAVIPLNDHNLREIGGNNGGKGGVVVNITNKSQSNVTVEKSSFNEDLGKYVLDIVVDGAVRDRGGFRRNFKAALGAQ